MVERMKANGLPTAKTWTTALRGLGMILAALALPAPAMGETAPAAPPAHAHRPAPFMRIARPDTNTIELQIASRPFQPPQASQPVIWLMAVSHIGESNYFASLQSALNQQELVLFEGVGGEAMKKKSRQSKKTSSPEASEEAPQSSSLQSTMAESLGLAFQLEAIDYDRPHFQNSDMSLSRLQAVLMKSIEDSASEGTDSGGANVEFLALMQAMDGSSWMGTILHMGVRLLGSSPKLQAMTRLLMIEILGQLEGDMSRMQGLPSSMQELIQVLIRERNKLVLQDLTRILQRPHPPQSIAVFYGAAHMDDMEQRLVSELKYRPGQDVWRSAISVDSAKSGLTSAEIETIRALVKWQMEALKVED